MSKKKSEFLGALGTGFQIFKSVADAVLARGGNDEDLRRLLSDAGLVGKVAELIVTKKDGVVTPTPNFTYDKTKDGWKLLEDVTEALEFKIKNLQMVSFLKSGESYINGEEMARRAKELKCNLGQQYAEYLLANQDQIPEGFRKHYLVFPGTVWQSPDGRRDLPVLVWNGDQWCLDFNWLGHDWYDYDRLIQPRKPAR